MPPALTCDRQSSENARTEVTKAAIRVAGVSEGPREGAEMCVLLG